MDDKDTIKTDELRYFANALSALQHSFSSLADWLEARKITELRGVGTPTAKRGIGYLAGFTASVLKAYSASQLGPGIEDESAGTEASNLWSAERMLRTGARRRKKTEASSEPTVPDKTSPTAPDSALGEDNKEDSGNKRPRRKSLTVRKAAAAAKGDPKEEKKEQP